VDGELKRASTTTPLRSLTTSRWRRWYNSCRYRRFCTGPIFRIGPLPTTRRARPLTHPACSPTCESWSRPCAQIRVFIVPHHRSDPHGRDYDNRQHINMFQEQNKPLRAFEVGSWGGEFNPECGSQKGDVVINEHWAQSRFANTAHAARGPENHAALFWPVVVGLGGGPPAQLTTSTRASGASHLAGKAMSHAPDPESKQRG
jgi:hypothetical protein